MILVGLIFIAAGCERGEKIIIGEGDWDSNRFHDQVARVIIEEGYGYEVEIVPADTAVLIQSLRNQSIDLSLELWSANIPSYEDDIETGYYHALSTNFDDNDQGLYIPRYLQEQYPDLVSVQDLIDHVDLFPDPQRSGKGIIYGGPESWEATIFLQKKMEAYNLDEHFIFDNLNSTAMLNATLVSAYMDEEPWVGYNWEPTWVLGMYDMVLLEDSEYSPEDYEQGIGAFATVEVEIVVTDGFQERYPDITLFLSNYQTSSLLTSEGLAYMQDNDAEADEAAEWFLLEYQELWKDWVPNEVYELVMEYLQS